MSEAEIKATLLRTEILQHNLKHPAEVESHDSRARRRWKQSQTRNYMNECSHTVDSSEEEKLRQRRISKLGLFFDDDGIAAPGNREYTSMSPFSPLLRRIEVNS